MYFKIGIFSAPNNNGLATINTIFELIVELIITIYCTEKNLLLMKNDALKLEQIGKIIFLFSMYEMSTPLYKQMEYIIFSTPYHDNNIW